MSLQEETAPGQKQGLAYKQAEQYGVNSSDPSPTAQRFYRPGLDVLRFVAFFCVFLSHALAFYTAPPWTARLALQGGMCLFFVLSSYLITELLLREKQSTGRIHLRAFFTRRILRIWPLYFAALGMAALTGLIWKKFHVPITCLIAYSLLVGNWYNVLYQPLNSPWQPLWSISLEEQFYLLWPFLVKKGRIHVWTISLLTFPVAAMMLIFCIGRLAYPPMAIQVWFNSFVQFAYFGLGAILAVSLKGAMIKWRAYQQVLLWALSALLFYASGTLFVTAHTSSVVIFGYSLIGVACVALFLSLFGDNCSGLKRPLANLGKISYGLYIFHTPCLFIVAHAIAHLRVMANHPFGFGTSNLIVGLLLTIVVAKLSYRLLEAPFLRLKQQFEFVKTRSV
jgi:peptidoglycan/LPS O-acetylase OafA/YrhL